MKDAKLYVRNQKKNDTARKMRNRIAHYTFMFFAILSASIIIGIILFIAIRGIQPFLPTYANGNISIIDFLFGMRWRPDQGIYGIGHIIVNTIVTAIAALIIVFPIAVLSSLFIVKMAPKKLATVLSTSIDLLASVPSVVFGFFAAGVITKVVVWLATLFGQNTAGGNSLFTVTLLLAIMMFPTMASFSIQAIKSVDVTLEHASVALGATKIQTFFKVVLPSAKSGIFAGAILGLGRAFGEATAVSMVVGNKMSGITTSVFDITRTLTSTMLAGFKETTGLNYDIRFSIGLVLLALILVSNALLHHIRKRIGN